MDTAEYRIKGIQDYRDTGLQGYSITWIQEYRDTGIQDYSGIQE